MTKQLPCDEFTILEYEMHPTSWGDATVFISQKTTDPNRDESDEEDKNDPNASDSDMEDEDDY